VRVQEIARRQGGALKWVDGAVEADITQPWPSLFSLLGEAFADGQAMRNAWWEAPAEVAGT